MRRNKSMPPEQIEKLPDIAQVKKENLIQLARRMYESNNQQPVVQS
jgi:hypothetical protein